MAERLQHYWKKNSSRSQVLWLWKTDALQVRDNGWSDCADGLHWGSFNREVCLSPSSEYALRSRQNVKKFVHMTASAAGAVLCSARKSCVTAMLGNGLPYQQW